MNFYLIWFDINVVVWKITLVLQYDLLQGRRCIFSIGGGATNFYWGTRPIFCLENLIFHLKKRDSVNYWGGMFPLCPFSAYGSVLFHPEPRLIFQKKIHWERVVIVLSVMLSTNFPILTFIWFWLILLCFQIKITERQGFKLCWDVIFEWFYWKWESDDFVW